ncbi:hypothetical protein BMS84_06280, partial [Leuconostoc pseudomesenteroides]
LLITLKYNQNVVIHRIGIGTAVDTIKNKKPDLLAVHLVDMVLLITLKYNQNVVIHRIGIGMLKIFRYLLCLI